MTLEESIDIGSDHRISFFVWSPDRDLNPQYAGWEDVDPAGAIVYHQRADDGRPCAAAVNFDLAPEGHPFRSGDRPFWHLVQLEPLTIEPSLLCSPDKRGCGDHGFIRNGRWVPA